MITLRRFPSNSLVIHGTFAAGAHGRTKGPSSARLSPQKSTVFISVFDWSGANSLKRENPCWRPTRARVTSLRQAFPSARCFVVAMEGTLRCTRITFVAISGIIVPRLFFSSGSILPRAVVPLVSGHFSFSSRGDSGKPLTFSPIWLNCPRLSGLLWWIWVPFCVDSRARYAKSMWSRAAEQDYGHRPSGWRHAGSPDCLQEARLHLSLLGFTAPMFDAASSALCFSVCSFASTLVSSCSWLDSPWLLPYR